jgi:hypothetical protein
MLTSHVISPRTAHIEGSMDRSGGESTSLVSITLGFETGTVSFSEANLFLSNVGRLSLHTVS